MTLEEEVQQAVKMVAEDRMFIHDQQAYHNRQLGYAGVDLLTRPDYEWDIWHRPAKQRYHLTPAQLRRMGIGR